MIPTQDSILPTVYQANNIGMDILKGQSPNNYDKVCYSTRVWTDFGLGLGLGP